MYGEPTPLGFYRFPTVGINHFCHVSVCPSPALVYISDIDQHWLTFLERGGVVRTNDQKPTNRQPPKTNKSTLIGTDCVIPTFTPPTYLSPTNPPRNEVDSLFAHLPIGSSSHRSGL